MKCSQPEKLLMYISKPVDVGDRFSGKSMLEARLRGKDVNELRPGMALDYSYIDIVTPADVGMKKY